MAKKRKGISLFLLLLMLGIILSSIYVLQKLRVYDFTGNAESLLSTVPLYQNSIKPFFKYREQRQVYAYNQLLEEIKKRQENLKIRQDQLDRIKTKLDAEKHDWQKKMDGIEKSQAEIEQLKKTYLSQIKSLKTQKQRIKELADIYSNMNPQEAVDRLSNLDDFMIIDILDEIASRSKEDRDNVSYLLTIFPAKRASELTKKMILFDKRATN